MSHAREDLAEQERYHRLVLDNEYAQPLHDLTCPCRLSNARLKRDLRLRLRYPMPHDGL